MTGTNSDLAPAAVVMALVESVQNLERQNAVLQSQVLELNRKAEDAEQRAEAAERERDAARQEVRRWQTAVSGALPLTWTVDCTNPELMVGSVVRAAEQGLSPLQTPLQVHVQTFTPPPSLSDPCPSPRRQPHGQHEEYLHPNGSGVYCRSCGAGYLDGKGKVTL